MLEIVEQIPPGHVVTYGDIAALLGSRGARVVGQVMARYGSDVAWWRVIRADGRPPREHEVRARSHYRDEGTPLIEAAESYRISPSARWDTRVPERCASVELPGPPISGLR